MTYCVVNIVISTNIIFTITWSWYLYVTLFPSLSFSSSLYLSLPPSTILFFWVLLYVCVYVYVFMYVCVYNSVCVYVLSFLQSFVLCLLLISVIEHFIKEVNVRLIETRTYTHTLTLNISPCFSLLLYYDLSIDMCHKSTQLSDPSALNPDHFPPTLRAFICL